ncbi:RDD family protein [Magnetospira thiophila]
MTTTLPSLEGADPRWSDQAPDPLKYPDFYDGIVFKRLLAFFLDGAIIVGLMVGGWVISLFATVGTFGLLSPLFAILILIPLIYHTLMIGGERSATLGMRALGIEVRRWDGGRPDYLQAAIQTLLFYGSIAATSTLILVIGLFNDRRRCLHDYLSGSVIVNKIDYAAVTYKGPD